MLERCGKPYFPEKPTDYWFETCEALADNPLYTKNDWKGRYRGFTDLAEIENRHKEYAFYYNMKYGIGGSGAVWSGMSWRFLPEDFRTRSTFGYGVDWPISYEDLSPHYDNVEQLFHTSGPKDLKNWPWSNNYPYPAFKQSYLDQVVGRIFAPYFDLMPTAHSMKNTEELAGGCIGSKTCVQHCPQNAKFRPDLYILPELLEKSNFTLIGDTPVLGVKAGRSGHIEALSCVLAGNPIEYHADLFYLCANTIENLRILLNSSRSSGKNIANSSGVLGEYFASHAVIPLRVTLDEKVYPGRGRPLTSAAINTLRHKDREHFNAYMLEVWNLDWTRGASGAERIRSLRLNERRWGEDLAKALERSEYEFAATMVFEVEMRKRNQVSLSRHRNDQFGLPIAHVDFELGARDKQTFEFLEEMDENLEELAGVENVKVLGKGLNGNHPMGGYRCGEDPKSSVVDARLRAHDHPNLYVLGGGVFNSTSALNPTHTIAALALWALDDDRLSL
jgi:choline dehydrogenase-like flavoprotein